MKTRTKILIDSWLGRTVVLFLNIIARILGRFLHINHSLEKIPEKIVVCKFLGMGSIIQSTPLLQTLRKSFPRAKIYFITSAANESLLSSIPIINETLVVDDRSFMPVIRSTFKLLRRLWREKIDLYVDLETYSYYSTAIATMSCARNRLGFYRVERNIRMGVYTHMMFFNPRAPIAQSYMQMARLAGCRDFVNELFPFMVTEPDRQSMHQKLKSISGTTEGNYIIINPNASDLRVERRWPLENMIRLSEELTRQFPFMRIYFIGSAYEFDWVEGLYSKIDASLHSRIHNTAGMFTLGELFALIRESDLIITNDTGPMHISFALGKATIALFGPASPEQYGQNVNAWGIYKNIYCSPCVHDFLTPPCKGNNQCMKLITIEDVVSLSVRLLRGEKADLQTGISGAIRFLHNDQHTALGIVERV